MNREYFRYRIVKIAGIAPGFPRMYLKEIVQLLISRSLNVVLGAAWDEPDMVGLLTTGSVAVGVTFPQSVSGAATGASLTTFIAKLAQDTHRAHIAKARFFVEGDVPPNVTMRLAAAGVDNISSPWIWPAVAGPDAMLKWPAARLAA